MGRAGWQAGRAVWSTEMAIWDSGCSQLCTHICKATERLARTVGASEGLSPQISHNGTVYSWSNVPRWHQGCSSPTGSGVCRLEKGAAIRNGLRVPSALPFSSQVFSWSDSFHVKEVQSFRLRPSGVLTYLTPDGTAPLRKQPGTPEI